MITKEGFNFYFDPNGCFSCNGYCCIGESGYIWINNNEIQQISNFLNLNSTEFLKLYTKKIKYKYSLKEIKLSNNNYACIFFDTINKKCKIYDVRPTQCRTFPFWEQFKNNNKVYKECPAVNPL